MIFTQEDLKRIQQDWKEEWAQFWIEQFWLKVEEGESE